MKKHRLHDIVLGMVIMALVMGLAIPAFASVATKTLEAHYMDIKLVIDGVEVTPKDVNGKVVEPFTVNGSTFLPVRAVGEALGKKVTWDGNTKTVYLGEVPAGAIKDWVGVRDMKEAVGSYVSTTGAKDLPHIAAAIKETNSKVGSYNGYLSIWPDDAGTSGKIYLETHQEDDRSEIWITGLNEYFMEAHNNPNGDYLKIVRAMLEDLVSDSEDIESVMDMVKQMDANYQLQGNVKADMSDRLAAVDSTDKIIENVHEFNTVVVQWGGFSGSIIGTMRIYNR